ncbi:protein kinase [Nocardiopsis sediminis]|uniref:non-specific serine/threonine protein kinase n=1 Tax=Nocardiopsis sediminis TaxID=1778267 RepID=A0ABV8FI82_9ACTN
MTTDRTPGSGAALLADRYDLKRAPLGHGGMGDVWEGHDTRLDREVAVKFVRFPGGRHDQELVRRFVRESRITARLQHPGVPAVFDAGTSDGRPYLVMQRIHGISVADLVAEQERLPVGWAAAIAAQVCSVLAAAHGASLVHRDLKPTNLMLEPDGTVKVLDFGLAVALEQSDTSRITRTGETPGTPAYMAPEQLTAGLSTPQSDLYALGCTLHEMLTGSRVFSGSTPFAVMTKQVGEEPLGVEMLRPDVPDGLCRIVSRLLAKRPEDRPADAQEAYDALLPFAIGLTPIPGVLHPPTLPSPTRMQAAVLHQVFQGTRSGRETTAPGFPAPGSRGYSAQGPGVADMGRPEIEKARSEAAALATSSRYRQAADVLQAAVHAARTAFGDTDTDVVRLRMDWANILFEGGDFLAAAPVYEALASDLAAQDASDISLVFRSRLQHATCHALTGDTSRALDILARLLADEELAYGRDDPRPLELRRQIGLLELGAGDREQAEHTLRALADDVRRVHGPGHPTLARIRELLSGPAGSVRT